MDKETKALWNSSRGRSLFGKMLAGKALTQEDRQTVSLLKQIEPPAKRATGSSRPSKSGPRLN